MPAPTPPENKVVDLAKFKREREQQQTEASQPPSPPTVADIHIRLSANGDVTWDSHNLTAETALLLATGCNMAQASALKEYLIGLP